MRIFVTGPAGSGKSTFVREFSKFLEGKGYEVACVNLDPATDPCFEASADVREFVRTEDVMRDYGLGVNGALLKSMELAEKCVDALKIDADYVLYDTPGQMEIFIYSQSGRRITEKLSDTFSAALFLVDSTLAADAEGFMAAIMQNVVVSLRLSLPTLTIFTKSDVAGIDVEEVRRKLKSGGLLAELLESVEFFIDYTTIPYRTIRVSSVSGEGFEDVFAAINELFCACGDIS
ncbi:MAG: ATP/GTP-binding protein [Archaeoglobaceae archaeon]